MELEPIWVRELTEDEQALASKVSLARRRNNRAKGVQDQKVCDKPGEKIDLDGFGAELAFCQMMGIRPDLTTHPRSGSCDCYVNGISVDIKHTERPGGNLLVRDSCLLYSKAFVLMKGKYPRFEYWGWAPWWEVANASTNNPGITPGTHKISVEDLRRDIIRQEIVNEKTGKQMR